jgi:ADP-heptose:LPS heptosyltransferase
MRGLEPLREDETGLYIFRKRDWERSAHVLENLRQGAVRHFGLSPTQEAAWQDSDGLVAPSACVRASAPARVCLHPSSARPNKNWPAAQFLTLADRLATEGHEPVFLSAADEQAHWQQTVGARYEVVVPGPLDKVAAYLRASGGAIVTDSGIGHLAAAVGTPTLSLFRKKSSARFWRPRGEHVHVLTASLRLPGGTGHRHWARFLTPKRVHAAYRELVTPSAAR